MSQRSYPITPLSLQKTPPRHSTKSDFSASLVVVVIGWRRRVSRTSIRVVCRYGAAPRERSNKVTNRIPTVWAQEAKKAQPRAGQCSRGANCRSERKAAIGVDQSNGVVVGIGLTDPLVPEQKI